MGKTRKVTEWSQGRLFGTKQEAGTQPMAGDRGHASRVFVNPDVRRLLIGARPLGDYLQEVGQAGPLRMAEGLKELDWSAFETQYAGPGRAPYLPRLMAGLVVYGLLKGVSSLRGLESLARTDLGCMWVCSGIAPDHSNIGRFILRHQEQFEGTFFEQITEIALKETESNAQQVAGDGTVIQAAASRYRTIKREALDRKLAASRQQCQADPDDDDKKGRQAKYEAADEALKQREDKRRDKGKPTDSLRVCTTEPDAPVQPLQTKNFAPSYKPSVLANQARVIVGQAVDPSNESVVLAPMMTQAARVAGQPVKRLLLDGNYCNETVINHALETDVDLLCPERGETPKALKTYPKSAFTYDDAHDVYVCPAGGTLTARSRSEKYGYVQYESRSCASCAQRHACVSTKTTRGRIIRRFAIDEAKDALRQVMQQPAARRVYAQRKAMVEPVFAFMAQVMNLRRFRRNGLAKVRLEFSIHAAAYNLGRVLAARKRLSLPISAISALFSLLWRLWAHHRHMPIAPALPIPLLRQPLSRESRHFAPCCGSWTPAFALTLLHI